VRFEAQRAQRQYDAVEPGNRLVARSLESSWEEKLRVVEAVEQEYDNWQRENHAEISAQDRAEILAIGEDLPGVWHAPTTTPVDRKHLLRLVVKDRSPDLRDYHMSPVSTILVKLISFTAAENRVASNLLRVPAYRIIDRG
jgi:hypothetical protein